MWLIFDDVEVGGFGLWRNWKRWANLGSWVCHGRAGWAWVGHFEGHRRLKVLGESQVDKMDEW